MRIGTKSGTLHLTHDLTGTYQNERRLITHEETQILFTLMKDFRNFTQRDGAGSSDRLHDFLAYMHYEYYEKEEED